ncbi:MAG: hypothetical protein JXX28_02805 [Deltaproteobacteria bacterium]|nr:hypothetical protein [Deltaproteobacteria bacterium]
MSRAPLGGPLLLGVVLGLLWGCPRAGGGAAAIRSVVVTSEAQYRARCGTCHEALPPGAFSAAEWPARLEAMAGPAGLSPEEHERLHRWLAEVMPDGS